MTLMLASVGGPQEAEIAIAHGADIIDVRDTSGSDFAAVPLGLVRATVTAVKGRRPVSAVTGQAPPKPVATLAAATALADAGVEYVEVSLLQNPKRIECIHALRPLAR